MFRCFFAYNITSFNERSEIELYLNFSNSVLYYFM